MKKLWNTSLVPIQWAKPHDATKMPQLLCVKLEDPQKNYIPGPEAITCCHTPEQSQRVGMDSVSDTFVSFPVLYDHKIGQGHLRSPGKKVKPKKSRYRAAIHAIVSDFHN